MGDEVKKEITRRKLQADYLIIGEDTAANTFFMGVGFKEMNEKPGAKTKESQYINEDTSSTSIVGYEPAYDFSADLIKSEKAIKHITDIAKYRKTGGDAEAIKLTVDLDEPVGEDGQNLFNARKETVSIEVSDFESEDGDMGISGSLKPKGDPIRGQFDTTTKTFTETTEVTP